MNYFRSLIKLYMAKEQKIDIKSQPVKGKGKEEAVNLSLQGELTIDHAVTVKKFLLENLGKYKSFNVKVSHVDNFDVTMIQLLQRFIWDAQQQGKNVEFELKLPDEFKSLVQRSGFQSFINFK